MKFNSILIANRGEIARRIIRTAGSSGYRTVAVYSEPDADSPHVAEADEAYLIGPGPVSQSYLNSDALLEAARLSGAGAVHPGYGFLSENPDFAEACEAAGLVFIGPGADAIRIMGNKAQAKLRMKHSEVPCVPGYEGAAQDVDSLSKAAQHIGYPVMVKAAAGGGGRGMRLVGDQADLPGALKLAASEALNAFGSAELIIEKAISQPRHVEIQIFADSHGNVIHMGERDCSVQRRHQKIIEEAPCPVMTPQLRAAMGTAAVTAAQSINYVGAGTVEFLLDEAGEFYFLEMNTRLQVEHPVTELITGLDLVALQIQVAQGLQLGLTQEEIELDGHAIEARLYAEDPQNQFMPATGTVALWESPSGAHSRVDHALATGIEITPYYDPMVAKISAWGSTREIARLRLLKALNETTFFGPQSNRDFLIRALNHSVFAQGSATTAFIEDNALLPTLSNAEHLAATAAVLDYLTSSKVHHSRSVRVSPNLLNWSSSGVLSSHYRYLTDDGIQQFTVQPKADGYRVVGDAGEFEVRVAETGPASARVEIEGHQHAIRYVCPSRGCTYLSMAGVTRRYENAATVAANDELSAGSGKVKAPMHGLLLEILVNQGAEIQKGQPVAIVEAMKMQHEVQADRDGKVDSVFCHAGEQVAADQVLLTLEPSS